MEGVGGRRGPVGGQGDHQTQRDQARAGHLGKKRTGPAESGWGSKFPDVPHSPI